MLPCWGPLWWDWNLGSESWSCEGGDSDEPLPPFSFRATGPLGTDGQQARSRLLLEPGWSRLSSLNEAPPAAPHHLHTTVPTLHTPRLWPQRPQWPQWAAQDGARVGLWVWGQPAGPA